MLTAGPKGACAAACASSFEQELLSRARTVGSVLVVRSSPMQVFMTQLDSIRNAFQSAALDCVTGSGRAEDLRDHVRTIHVYERDRFCVQHPDEALFVRLRDIGYDLGVVTYGTETARSHYAHVHEFIRTAGPACCAGLTPSGRWLPVPSRLPKGETLKCRDRLLKYCQGAGLDLGCHGDKIRTSAIGVDFSPVSCVNIVGDVRDLHYFRDDALDYVFSSHCLEDLDDTEGTLREWFRVLRPGGYLVLYLPHRDHYPNIGHSHANAAHKHDFVEQDVISAAQRVAGCRVVHCECHGTGPYDYERLGQIEYSFELVLEKLGERSRP